VVRVPPVVVGRVQLPQHLLRGLRGQVRHPVHLGAGNGEMRTLLDRAQGLPPLGPQEPALLQPDIPHRPAGVRPPGQPLGLPRGRVQPVGAPGVRLHAPEYSWFMAVNGDVRTGRHCVFVLHAHLVFYTKYRHDVFTAAHLRRLEEIMRAVSADFECELVEFNGETNHVHLLVNFPPKIALSRLVNSLKGVSSRRMRQEFPDLTRHYWRAQRLWSGSYFAGSVGGAPISVLRQYIEQQNRPI